VRSQVVANVSATTLPPILVEQITASSRLMTDGAGQHRNNVFGNDFASHEVVDHGIGEYVRGEVHTNTIESYRHNERTALGVNDAARTHKALQGIVGKRLTYRRTNRQGAEA
jgi:hypothetical protein